MKYRASRKVRHLSVRLQKISRPQDWLRKNIINTICSAIFAYIDIVRGLSSGLIKVFLNKSDSISPGMTRYLLSVIDGIPFKRSTDCSTARYYLKMTLSKTEFFKILNRDVRYVALRWNRSVLVNWSTQNDLDLLIMTEDLNKILSLCTKGKRSKGLPIDIYTSTHMDGFLRDGCSYFSGDIAHEILCNRKLSIENIYVPDDSHQTLSFLYHLLFQKSNIFSSKISNHGVNAKVARYFTEAIYHANKTVHIMEIEDGVINLSPQGICESLKRNGWFPSLSNLRFLALRNTVLRELLLSELDKNQCSTAGDLITLIIREKAVDLGYIPLLLDYIEKNGYCILHHSEISPGCKVSAEREIRNGNWGGRSNIGGFGGGPPAYVISFIDFKPDFRGYNHDAEFPFVDNANVRKKQELRQLLWNRLYYWDHCHLLHSSDDHYEALEYLAICLDQNLYEEVHTCLERQLTAFKKPSFSVRELSNSRTRSRVDLMATQTGLVVRKTYRLDKLDFFKRELDIYRSTEMPSFTPRLLKCNHNSFDIDYIEAEPAASYLSSSHRRQFLKSRLLDIYHEAYSRGIALIDLHPGNLLIDANGKPWVIDYEYSHRYVMRKPGKCFLSGYDIIGVPPDANAVVPPKSLGEGRTYNNTWMQFLGPITSQDVRLCISRNKSRDILANGQQ